MERKTATKILSDFINANSFGEEREELHEALSCLEDKAIRYDKAKE